MPARLRTSPRKTPRQRRAQATIDAILDAAARILIREGYARATTNRVAVVAGVSIGTLYQYFPSKDAVVAALVERHIGRMRALLAARVAEVAGAPVPEFVRAMVTALFAAHAVDPDLHRTILEHVPLVERAPHLLALQREMHAVVAAALAARGGLRRDDVALAAVVACEAVTAVAHAALFDADLAARRTALVEEVVDLVARYLTADATQA
ncbi:MAG TPA: TetR/AcrR family transcriptional regulator [Minicystis sp.]|nr:TetR/AcrR family transcriptional regulator [Minicystis sp.]